METYLHIHRGSIKNIKFDDVVVERTGYSIKFLAEAPVFGAHGVVGQTKPYIYVDDNDIIDLDCVACWQIQNKIGDHETFEQMCSWLCENFDVEEHTEVIWFSDEADIDNEYLAKAVFCQGRWQ